MLANQRETVAVFWTGGWDSSYRVIELSRMDVNIQPVYILDESRKSHSRELNSIEVITEILKQRQETIADFLPIDIIKVSDIPENEEITNAWTKLKDELNYGIQHDWTARVAYYKYPMIEMCIEKVTKGYMPTREAINKYGKTKKYDLGGVIIDRDNSDTILNLVLGNIALPIFNITELEMLSNIKEWGYEDVMKNIWFCHTPIGGKPCGLCSPCHTKIDSGMEWLMPEAAIKRCATANAIEEKYGKTMGKIYRRLLRSKMRE